MKPQVFRPSALVLLLAAAFAHMQAAADTSAELETIEIKARSRDQRGADDVYRKTFPAFTPVANTSNATARMPPATCSRA